MKVLVITRLYPGNETDSVKNVSFAIHYLIREVASFGIEITKVIRPEYLFYWRRLSYQPIHKKISIDGINVETKSFLNLPKLGITPSKRELNYLKDNLNGVELVISHMDTGAILANKIYENFNIPFMHVLHATDMLNLGVIKNALSNAKCIYARSWIIKKMAEEYGLNVKGVIYSGVNKNIINENVKRDLIPNQKLKIITVSNLEKRKNIDIVINSLSVLPVSYDWELTIIGDGDEYKHLQNLILNLGLEKKVKMLGFRDKTYCIKCMKESDVFVLPSILETFGLVYLEAMASGCIVIGCKGEGLDGLMLNGENSYLAQPGSVNDLTKIFIKIFTQSQKHILENSMHTIKKYTQDIAVKNYAECIKKCTIIK